MEAIDAARRQSFSLPSLSQLDADRSRWQDANSQRKHSLVSLFHPFSNHLSSPASAAPGPLGGLLSPPESRRTSGDDKDQQRAPVHQPLPSIREALGRPDPPLAFSAPPPLAPPSAPASATQSYFFPPPTTSPIDHRARAFSTDFRGTQGPGNPFSHPPSPFLGASTSTAPPPPSQTQFSTDFRPSPFLGASTSTAPPPPPSQTQFSTDFRPSPFLGASTSTAPPPPSQTQFSTDFRGTQGPDNPFDSQFDNPFSRPPSPFLSASISTAPPPPPSQTQFSTDFRGTQGPGDPFSRPPSPFLSASISTAPPPPPSQTQASDSLPRPSVSEARPSYPELRPSISSPRPSFSAPQHNSRLPTLHPLRTNQSPPPGPSQSNVPHPGHPPQQSSAHDSSGPHSAGPTNPNYGYSQYPSNYPLSAPAPGAQSAPYPPSAAVFADLQRPYPAPAAWPEDLADGEKISRFTLAGYGESVRRQLESFDMEASLNEMVDGAGRIINFSKECREQQTQQPQQTQSQQRNGIPPQAMPPLQEVQDMLQHSERILVSLQRMRDVIFNHQRANRAPEPPPEIRYTGTNGVEYEARADYVEEGSSFMVPDMKKIRRGRAAPPGRCHSCNRAETPEWRRGPDGARTLCNACGLHYAKLTRKMGGKHAMTGSNLRPKSVDQGPSTA